MAMPAACDAVAHELDRSLPRTGTGTSGSWMERRSNRPQRALDVLADIGGVHENQGVNVFRGGDTGV